MSMYADYLKERLGDDVFETEQGFATYRFTDDKTVYLVDLYVRPEFRKSGVATDLGDAVAEIAKARGCTALVGSVVPSARGSGDSMKVLLAYGMVPTSSGNDFVLFRKELN